MQNKITIEAFIKKFRNNLSPRKPNYYTKEEIIALAIILKRHTRHSIIDKLNDIEKRMGDIDDVYKVATLFKIK